MTTANTKKSLARFFRHFHNIEEVLIAYLLAGMVINTFIQVVARRLFNSGSVWANELTQLLFAYLVMLGMAYGIRQGTHIGVDFAVRFFPPKGQRVLNLAAVVICLAYALAMFLTAAGMTWTYATVFSFLDTEDLKIPVWFNYGVVAFGFLMVNIRLVIVGAAIWRGSRYAISAAHEAVDMIEDLKDTS